MVLLFCSCVVTFATSQDHLAALISDHNFVPEQSNVQPEELRSTSEQKTRRFLCLPGVSCRPG